MKTKNTLKLFMVCCLLLSSKLISAQCHIDDWTALKAFYEATDGDNWHGNRGWEVVKNDEPPTDCNLENLTGVYLDETGRVSIVNLFNSSLKGNIPAELGKLSNLKQLDLSGNHLTGILPPELGNLRSLKELDLRHNYLTSIPPELGDLGSLEILILMGNRLTSIPPELGNLSNLEKLNLSLNQLIIIPPEIVDLYKLVVLNLAFNKLNGNLPPGLGNLTSLEKLYLQSNELSGNVPPELGNQSELVYLDLRDNQLTGSIPAELGKLENLGKLYLENNQLSGNIPSELGNLSMITSLHLQNNQLTGSIPSELGNLSMITSLRLQNNQLTGSIPSEFGNLENLVFLYLENNELRGTIPPEMGNLLKLERFYLNNNKLTGNIPNEFSNLSLSYFNVSNNQLSGKIPYLNIVDDYYGEIYLSEFYFQYNYFVCGDFENFDIQALGPWKPFGYSPQRYSHNGEQNFLVDSSTEAVLLSAPFSQTGNFTYQWYKNGLQIDEATDSILYLSSIQLDDVGRYVLNVKDENCVEPFTNISDPITVRRTDLEGCTDINGCNYNEFAMIDDGSCEYLWCDTMTNPIKIRTANEVILSDNQIKFDIVIDSLGLNYSADGLTFTLDTRGNYRFESIEVVNSTLLATEVDISKLNKNIVSIDRISQQRLASNEPVLSATACIIADDVPSDEYTCSHFLISGGTQLASGHFIDFDNIYIDIPFSSCSPYGGYGVEGNNWLPLVATISPENCRTQTTGLAEIKILQEGQSPFSYKLGNEKGEIVLEETDFTNYLIELTNLQAGTYELTVSDSNGKQTIMHICVPLMANIFKNEACNTSCADYLIVPGNKITGNIYTAKKEIEIKGFIDKNETVEFSICD